MASLQSMLRTVLALAVDLVPHAVLDADLLERLRSGAGSVADLERFCGDLGWSAAQLVSLLSSVAEWEAGCRGSEEEGPRTDHHLNPDEVRAVVDHGLPAQLVLREMALHLAQLCPHCAEAWSGGEGVAGLQPVEALRQVLALPEDEAPPLLAVARDQRAAFLEASGEERGRLSRLWRREPSNVYLVELMRHSSWQSHDGPEALARAQAAAGLLGRLEPKAPRLRTVLSIGCVVATARARRLQGDVDRAAAALDVARRWLLELGVHDLATITELDQEQGLVLWARLQHERARTLLQRCAFTGLLLDDERGAADLAALLVEVDLDAGAVAGAAGDLAMVQELSDAPGFDPWRRVLLEAKVQVAQGQPGEARETVARGPRGSGHPDSLEPPAGALRVELLLLRGRLDVRTGLPAKALLSLQEAHASALRQLRPLLVARCAVALAEAARVAGQPAEAVGSLAEARNLSGLPMGAVEALSLLEDALVARLEPPTAFEQLERFLERLGRNPGLPWRATS